MQATKSDHSKQVNAFHRVLGLCLSSTAGPMPHVCEEVLQWECTSVHVHVCVRVSAQKLEAFWTRPRVKGSANTLSLSSARVITPG